VPLVGQTKFAHSFARHCYTLFRDGGLVIDRASIFELLLFGGRELLSRLRKRSLGDVLVHNFLVELVKVLASRIIVELSFVGLDNIGFIGRRAVGKFVAAAGVELTVDDTLVLTSGIHLVHQAACGRLVLLVTRVKLGHGVVEGLVILHERC